MEKKFVVVAGNMGIGKTTLVRKLSQKLKWHALFEPHEDNPYLKDFYADMSRWALHSQIYFLRRRVKQYQQIKESITSVLQDRCIYEDAEVFARNLFERGDFPRRDWENYWGIYDAVSNYIQPPDLLIYLRSDLETLQERIRIRGRKIEKSIPVSYLVDLQELYARWINSYRLSPVLELRADQLDFVKDESHLDLIAEKMLEKLSGHETLDFSSPS